jgi:hypothetical protein
MGIFLSGYIYTRLEISLDKYILQSILNIYIHNIIYISNLAVFSLFLYLAIIHVCLIIVYVYYLLTVL